MMIMINGAKLECTNDALVGSSISPCSADIGDGDGDGIVVLGGVDDDDADIGGVGDHAYALIRQWVSAIQKLLRAICQSNLLTCIPHTEVRLEKVGIKKRSHLLPHRGQFRLH